MMNLELRNKEDLTLLESSMVNGYVNILRNENGDKFVDLEDLYNYLEIKTKRKDWLSRNIENNELFEEGFDYIKLTLKKEHESGIKYEKQIIATMDCAKQLSMMAKNDKSKNIRKYFIECEKQLHIDNTKDKLLLSLFSNNPLEVATAHKSLLEIETKPLIATIEKQKPDVEFSQRVQDSVNKNYSMQEASKLLKLPFGRNKLLEVLRHEDIKFLDSNNIAYQTFVTRGYFKVILSDINGYLRESTKITGKGINWLDTKYRDKLINTYEKIKNK